MTLSEWFSAWVKTLAITPKRIVKEVILVAKPPAKSYQGSKRYEINRVVIHTTDTPLTWMKDKRTSEKVAEIRRWHMTKNPPWKDIGYHWIIDRDGTVAQGRKESVIGAGVEGLNRGVIHITLIGGKGGKKHDKLRMHYSREQEKSLLNLLKEIDFRAGIDHVSGHNEHANRECPCFYVPTWLESCGGLTKVLGRSA